MWRRKLSTLNNDDDDDEEDEEPKTFEDELKERMKQQVKEGKRSEMVVINQIFILIKIIHIFHYN